MKITLVLALCVLAAMSIGAQSLTVSYLEGDIQVNRGSSWTPLSIGDAVPATASVRVQGTGSVQLRDSGTTLFLNRAGVYAIRDLLASTKQLAAKGVTSALSKAFRLLGGAGATNQGTISGARAADQGQEEDGGWAESSAGIFLDAGREYLKAGNLGPAIEQLTLALDSATDAEAPEIRYYLASAAAQNGDMQGAWKQIAGVRPGAADAWHGDFVLLKAKLLEDTRAYTEAVDWLAANDLSADAQRAQVYYLLLGLAYRGSGGEPDARSAFKKAVAVSADTDLGKAASELLK